MSNKNVKVKVDTRFMILIDKNLENVYLKDLGNTDGKLTAIESSEVLKQGIREIKIIAGLIENKMQENKRIKNKKTTAKKLKIIKGGK